MKKRGAPISDTCYQRVSGVPRHLSMVIIVHYSFVYKTGDPYPHVKSEEKVPCPYCGGALRCIGTRRRKLILKDGSQKIMVIRRLKCTQCHHIHHELPDCVVPYRRYDEDSIEMILSSAGNENSDDSVCEESTIMRIRRWFYLHYRYFEAALKKFISKGASISLKLPLYPLRAQTDGWLKRLVRAIVNSGGWAHTRSAWSRFSPNAKLLSRQGKGGSCNGQTEDRGDRVRPSPDDRRADGSGSR